MTNSVTIYTLIVGLICGFAQAARGQQSGPVQPPPTGMMAGSSQNSDEGRPSRTWRPRTIRLLRADAQTGSKRFWVPVVLPEKCRLGP